MPRVKYVSRRKFFPAVITHIATGAPVKFCNAGGFSWDSHHANYLGFKKHFLTDPEFEKILAERLKKNENRISR